MFNNFTTTLYRLIPQIVLDEFDRYQQGEELFALNQLYERALSKGIAQSTELLPFASSLVVIAGDKSNFLEVSSQGNGNNPDPISREPLKIIEKMAGTENIINMKGEKALEHRKKIKPFLSDESAKQTVFVASQLMIKKVLNNWHHLESLQDNISYFTTNVVSACVLGIPEISFQEAQVVRQAGKELAKGNPNSESFIKMSKEMSQLNHKLLAKFSENILHTENYTKSKAEINGEDDSTDKLQKTRSISNLLVESNLSTLIMAALVYVNKNPEIFNKLGQELLGKDDLDLETLRSLPYLHCVYKESLRYISPTAVIIRQTSKPVDLNITDEQGHKKIYHTKNRSLLFAPIRRIHHDPRYWADPEKFNPDRFFDREKDKHFIPFSLGQRSCPAAANFNEIVFKTAMTEIIKYKIELDKEIEIIPKDALSSRWKNDYFLTKLELIDQSKEFKLA